MIANFFNRVIGKFTMKYFGIEVYPRKLLASDLEYIVTKIQKIRANW
jgi:hypothetical protein